MHVTLKSAAWSNYVDEHSMSKLKRKAEETGSEVKAKPFNKSEQSDSKHEPALAQLFASSSGPTKILSKAASPTYFSKSERSATISSEKSATGLTSVNISTQEKRKNRKRKRKITDEDNIEGRYMRQLALEEGYGQEKLASTIEGSTSTEKKTKKPVQDKDLVGPGRASESEDSNMGECKYWKEPPNHETIAPGRKDAELEKASRTVFLANVSTLTIKKKTAKKALMDHLTSFFPTLPELEVPHAIESVRFRSTAFGDSSMPRKAAFIKHELMDTTTRSTNAYVVYTTQVAAREAMKKLNGTLILDRHLRVDSVAHPAKQHHRRCVFIGNLGFVDDTTRIDAAKNEEYNSKPRNQKEPADVEEGLWRQFGKVGIVESVRVVRDKNTRVGKGFAYVQFWDANAVEKALLLHGKKFPPMLPRILRVTRAKGTTKTRFAHDNRNRHVDAKPSAKSLAGRANKLLGRAGAAHIKKKHEREMRVKKPTKSSNKRAEMFRGKIKQK